MGREIASRRSEGIRASSRDAVTTARHPAWLPHRPLLLSSLVLVVCASATGWGWYTTREHVRARQEARFQLVAAEAALNIRNRMLHAEQLLRAGQGLFAASERVDRGEWRTFVGSVLSQRQPYLGGIAFIARVPAEARGAFETATRADGAPDFAVRPPGPATEHAVVTYLEPAPPGPEPLGFDLSTVPAARSAMERAGDTRLASLSTPLDPLPGPAGGPAVELYLPVYCKNVPQESAPGVRDGLDGWVSIRLLTDAMCEDALGAAADLVDVEVFDHTGVEAPGGERLLYDSGRDAVEGLGEGDRSQPMRSEKLDFGGRTWRLHFAARPGLDFDGGRIVPWIVLGAGTLISALLSFVTFGGLANARSLARALARAEGSERRAGCILDAALDAVVTTDEEGRVTHWNPQAEITFGWSRDEAVGRPVAELIIPPRLRGAHVNALRRFGTTGKGSTANRRVEVPALHRDGHEFAAELTVAPLKVDGAYVFSAFVRDISKPKAAEEALRFKTALLESQSEASVDGILVVSPDGTILSFNRRFVQLWNIPDDSSPPAPTRRPSGRWRPNWRSPKPSRRRSRTCTRTPTSGAATRCR